ncbi:MAG: hypothetical protein J6T34_01255 [Bacilli bacterium]|nr:hypothetical protein [Bacilli bacterium]
MSYRYTQQDNDVVYGVNSYVADTVADLDAIEIAGDKPGSTCIVIEDSSVYMLDTNKVWQKL